jgi:hypothetical protein
MPLINSTEVTNLPSYSTVVETDAINAETVLTIGNHSIVLIEHPHTDILTQFLTHTNAAINSASQDNISSPLDNDVRSSLEHSDPFVQTSVSEEILLLPSFRTEIMESAHAIEITETNYDLLIPPVSSSASSLTASENSLHSLNTEREQNIDAAGAIPAFELQSRVTENQFAFSTHHDADREDENPNQDSNHNAAYPAPPQLILPQHGRFRNSPVYLFNHFMSELHNIGLHHDEVTNAHNSEYLCSKLRELAEQIKTEVDNIDRRDDGQSLLNQIVVIQHENDDNIQGDQLSTNLNAYPSSLSTSDQNSVPAPSAELDILFNEFAEEILDIAANSHSGYDVEELLLIVNHFVFVEEDISITQKNIYLINKLKETKAVSKEQIMGMFPGYDGSDCITQINENDEAIVFLKSPPLARPYVLSSINMIIQSNHPLNPYTRENIGLSSFVERDDVVKLKYIVDHEFFYKEIKH